MKLLACATIVPVGFGPLSAAYVRVPRIREVKAVRQQNPAMSVVSMPSNLGVQDTVLSRNEVCLDMNDRSHFVQVRHSFTSLTHCLRQTPPQTPDRRPAAYTATCDA